MNVLLIGARQALQQNRTVTLPLLCSAVSGFSALAGCGQDDMRVLPPESEAYHKADRMLGVFHGFLIIGGGVVLAVLASMLGRWARESVRWYQR